MWLHISLLHLFRLYKSTGACLKKELYLAWHIFSPGSFATLKETENSLDYFFACLCVYVSPTCHDVGCSALVNNLPSLSYRLLSSSDPSISYTYMSVSEISTLKDRRAQTDILGAQSLETLSVDLFTRQVLPSQLSVQWESIRGIHAHLLTNHPVSE